MAKYLGETLVEQKDTEFKDFKPQDWAMYYIERYGGIDGDHHKTWVLDQVSRILKGTTLTIKVAKWDDGLEEYRVDTNEPSKEYLEWVEDMKCWDEDKEAYIYGYDEGIAP